MTRYRARCRISTPCLRVEEAVKELSEVVSGLNVQVEGTRVLLHNVSLRLEK